MALVPGSQVQRRGAILSSLVLVGAGIAEEARYNQVAVAGSHAQRRGAILSSLVLVGASRFRR